jgi:hypothetical protein
LFSAIDLHLQESMINAVRFLFDNTAEERSVENISPKDDQQKEKRTHRHHPRCIAYWSKLKLVKLQSTLQHIK